MQGKDFRQIGRNRYAFTWTAPWGQEVPAEMIVTTPRGWAERPEARNPRWSAYPVGPAVVAIRLKRSMRLRPAIRDAPVVVSSSRRW
jgi:hypothetical protein